MPHLFPSGDFVLRNYCLFFSAPLFFRLSFGFPSGGVRVWFLLWGFAGFSRPTTQKRATLWRRRKAAFVYRNLAKVQCFHGAGSTRFSGGAAPAKTQGFWPVPGATPAFLRANGPVPGPGSRRASLRNKTRWIWAGCAESLAHAGRIGPRPAREGSAGVGGTENIGFSSRGGLGAVVKTNF